MSFAARTPLTALIGWWENATFPMPHLLNYKYEIFPTRPQRVQLNRILRETRIQWNKAVIVRKKLKAALVAGQFDHVVKKCLSLEKWDGQGNRRRAIERFMSTHDGLDFDSAAKLFDIKNFAGKIVDEVDKRYLDIGILANDLKTKHKEELAERKAAQAKDVEWKKLPKLKTYWQVLRAINQYSGYAAKTFMDKSFHTKNAMALSGVRFNISGSANSIRWNQAVSPKPGQRTFGATGEPQYKRRGEGFAYQIQNTQVDDLIRKKKKRSGSQIYINALTKGNAFIDLAYHRNIPKESKIKNLTVNSRSGRYFVVLSLEVPEIAWTLVPMCTGWEAGIDPGARTALTVGLRNNKTGDLRHLAIHYEFLEKSLEKLEKIQQALALKQGPRRKRTEKEVEEALSKFSKKSSVSKLNQNLREETIVKERGRLERRMIRQEASKKWRNLSLKVSGVQFKIANRRQDVLHKISRALVEGCDAVGVGHWEPEREVSYRNKLKRLKKQVRFNVAGATEELKKLQEEKTKQGPKGVKKRRRGGRDRSIATLRRLIEEKAERASIFADTNIQESYTTVTCSSCGETTVVLLCPNPSSSRTCS